MKIEQFLKSKEYKTAKEQYEKEFFKIFGEYGFYNGDKVIIKSPAQMHEYFKNKKIKINVEETKETNSGIITTCHTYIKDFYQIWSEDPEMREYVEIVFNCNSAEVKERQFNLFQGFNHLDNVKFEKNDLSPVFDHMRSLVNYNEEHFIYLICWLAHIVQKPHILPHTCIIIISEEGIGKDLFSSFISSVLNKTYCHNTEKLELICGKFNTILGGKLFITINETDPVESRERIENIKFLITADEMTIEAKNKDPVKCKNYARFLFLSNRLFAFPVEEGSRRPVIFKSSNKYLPKNYGVEENKNYFTNLAENIYKNVEYQKAFLEYLRNYDISKWNPKEFTKSELHKELEESSISPLVQFLADYVYANGKSKTIRIGATELLTKYNQYSAENHLKYSITPSKFGVELTQKFGIEKIKSNGIIYVIEPEKLKKILEDKYKYKFDNVVSDDDECCDEDGNLIDKECEIIVSLKDEITRLKQQLEELTKTKVEVKPEAKPEVKPEVKPEAKPEEIKPKYIKSTKKYNPIKDDFLKAFNS